ncbi:MAG: J domain-containing protein [Candidatus Lambdaproteobacteria bacterium]|nr:J domain-containing protein [Candidatus Lambdaproteobacteria bacterium]
MDHYNVLGVEPGASAERIRAAYRRAAKGVHPDSHPHLSGAARAAMERRFIQLAQAYQTLADPARRAAYDRERAQSRPAPGPAPRPATAAGRGSADARESARRARAAEPPPRPSSSRPSSSRAEAPPQGHAPKGAAPKGVPPHPGAAGRRAQTAAEATDLDNLLRDSERILARFGLDLRQPFERLIEALLAWARDLYAAATAPGAEAHPPPQPSPARGEGERRHRAAPAEERAMRGTRPGARPQTAAGADSELEAELAALKRGRRAGSASGAAAGRQDPPTGSRQAAAAAARDAGLQAELAALKDDVRGGRRARVVADPVETELAALKARRREKAG